MLLSSAKIYFVFYSPMVVVGVGGVVVAVWQPVS